MSNMLGHYDAGFTLRTYTHYSPDVGKRGGEDGEFYGTGTVKEKHWSTKTMSSSVFAYSRPNKKSKDTFKIFEMASISMSVIARLPFSILEIEPRQV